MHYPPMYKISNYFTIYSDLREKYIYTSYMAAYLFITTFLV